MLTFLQASV
jgi:hypothetical protein